MCPQDCVQQIRLLSLSLHPKGMVSRIQNRAEWTAHLGHRLARLARLTGDQRLAELLTEIRTYPGVAPGLLTASRSRIV